MPSCGGVRRDNLPARSRVLEECDESQEVRDEGDTSRVSITLSSRDAFAAALATGNDIALCAYTLAPGGTVVRALEVAGDRGARVAVRLAGRPTFGHGRAPGDATGLAAMLRAHHVAVETEATGAPPAHLKAAVIDNEAFLDDRNWATSGHETIVRDDDAGDVAAVRAAIFGQRAPCADIAFEKEAALALEVATIRAAPGDRIDVATESFGGCEMSAALVSRARAGTHVRLEVTARALAADASGREHTVIANLVAAGAEVRAVASNEKFAIAGETAWLGSANATYSPGPMSDWGAVTRDPAIEADLATTFEDAWARGTPVA